MRRIVAVVVLALVFFMVPNTASAQTDWCNYFVGQYAWYEHQYNTYMNYYFASGDAWFSDIAQLYLEQMFNLVPAIQASCGGYGPTP